MRQFLKKIGKVLVFLLLYVPFIAMLRIYMSPHGKDVTELDQASVPLGLLFYILSNGVIDMVCKKYIGDNDGTG